ncbi:N-acetyltransferase [bacterium]|nr:N-acetyltransferase [bacterium]
MKMNIRPEQSCDYADIADLTLAAFTRDSFVDEVILVDVLRHRREFKPSWSLVAEIGGRVIGHAMFHQYQVGFQGRLLESALLAPLAVHPDFQRQGIGGALMKEGHKRIQQQNIPFSFLLGHASYYPRFGYETHLFGINQLKMDVDLSDSSADFELKSVKPVDVSSLIALWHTTFAKSDFALFPGHDLLDWIPHTITKAAEVMVENGEITGYARYDRATPQNPTLFMAKDTEAAQRLLAALRRKISGTGAVLFTLPLPPACQEWFPEAEVLTDAWKAGMVKIMDTENEVISRYCQEVKAGIRLPGAPVWPPHFELS